MPSRMIYIKNRRYYYYDTFSTYEQAKSVAQRYHKRNKKNKYFILTTESGIILNVKNHHLYLTKTMRLFG